MKRFGLIALLCLLSCLRVQAGDLLGASYETILKRLGYPVASRSMSSGGRYQCCTFENQGWRTAIIFKDEISKHISSEKMDGSLLTESENAAFLAFYGRQGLDGREQKWYNSGRNHLIRADGNVHVVKEADRVTIYTSDVDGLFTSFIK